MEQQLAAVAVVGFKVILVQLVCSALMENDPGTGTLLGVYNVKLHRQQQQQQQPHETESPLSDVQAPQLLLLSHIHARLGQLWNVETAVDLCASSSSPNYYSDWDILHAIDTRIYSKPEGEGGARVKNGENSLQFFVDGAGLTALLLLPGLAVVVRLRIMEGE